MRLFVGAELPEETAGVLAGWARGLAGPALRPVPAASLHVTLFFLGERDEGELEGLRAALRALPAAHAPLRTTGAARLGRVVAVDLDDVAGTLAAVHARGFPGWVPERRRFRPHVTVARARGGPGRPSALPPAPDLAFAAPALTLFRSRPGSHYEPLERAVLPGA